MSRMALSVRPVGFGAKRLLKQGYTAEDRERAVRLVRRAVELGVDHVDTAAFYPSVADAAEGPGGFTSLGVANQIVREALTSYDDHAVVATKVGPLTGRLARPDELRGLVEADLRALGRSSLDLVYLRQAGLEESPSTTARWPTCRTPGWSSTSACPTSAPSTWSRRVRSRRSRRCRTGTASTSAG